MRDIESYNSSYPLAYYEVGAIYSFYGQMSAKGTPATSDAIRKYASALDALFVEERESAIKPVRESAATVAGSGGLNRFYAVVIEKIKSGNNAYIVVMLCNKHNGKYEYYTRKYSVSHGCATDGKDLMPTSSHLDFETETFGKVGGITLAGKKKKVGGITRAGREYASTPGVGGITKVNNRQDNSQNNSDIKNGAKVGGVTLVREQKVGGITRVRQRETSAEQ